MKTENEKEIIKNEKLEEKNETSQNKNKVLQKVKNVAEWSAIVVMVVGVASIPVGIGTEFVVSKIRNKNKLNGVSERYFTLNGLGYPLTMDVGNNPIPVIIDKNFSDEQKKCIVQAVEELDEDLLGVNYKIELNCTKPPKKCINIIRDDLLHLDYSNTYAVAMVDQSGLFSGFIKFPVEIKVEPHQFDGVEETNAEDDVFFTFQENVDLFKGLIKHEFLHTLGLKDIHDSSERYKTLAFGYHGIGERYLHDLSERDKNILNTVYQTSAGKYDVSVALPKNMYIDFGKKTAESELEM